jgi:cytochrome b561
LLSFLWPTKLNPDLTDFTLLGRILHWIAVVVSLMLGGLAVWGFVEGNLPERGNDYWSTKALGFDIGQTCLALALLTYAVGRIGRRLLSKE